MWRGWGILIFIFSFFHFRLAAQTDEFRNWIESTNPGWEKLGIHDTASVMEFYRVMEYKPGWMGGEAQKNKVYLFELLENAADYGLDPADYQYDFIKQYKDSVNGFQFSEDWRLPDLKLTDAAIHFYRDLAFGNLTPSFSYSGLDYKPDCISVSWQLAKHIQYNSLQSLANVLQPTFKEIKVLQSAIVHARQRMAEPGFKEEIVTSTQANTNNKPLIRKLYSLGILDSMNAMVSSKSIVGKIKEAQLIFGLLADGVIRPSLLKELNISLSTRVKQLSLSINYYRWLYCLSRSQPVIVVNLPAAYLKVYSEEKSILEMRLVVGKPATPTPTLSSRLTDLILYPYWTVPNSIATKELLPSIKRNPNYIDQNNYQVLDKKGNRMDHRSINWHASNVNNFPFIIRQSTGCDNALGVLKLNFFNPFSVYLHDTPSKSLFMLNKRFFSHGCMRMENPMDMGYLVLRENAIAIDTLEEKGCLRNQSPTIVPVTHRLPVIVWYNPAGIDKAGRLNYYEDVYNKFPGLKLK